MNVDDLKRFSEEFNATMRLEDIDHTKLICWNLDDFDMPMLRRMWNHFRMHNDLAAEKYGEIMRPKLTSDEENWYNEWKLDEIFTDFIKLDNGKSLFLCFCMEDGTEYIIKKCLDTEQLLNPDGVPSKFIIIVDETYKKAARPRNIITAKAHGYSGQFILTCVHVQADASTPNDTPADVPADIPKYVHTDTPANT